MTNPETTENINSEEVVEQELSEIELLQQQLEEANEAKLRALADFKNYQRRSVENEIRASSSGKAQVVRAIVPSLEQINMAIEHAGDDSVVKGFQMARDALMQGLVECGVTTIFPEIGDEFDPQLHEALMRQDSEDLETDRIVMVMQSGFQLGDIVISPAKVAVSS
ncbi:MAG: nucleotide exchange factor GrpE [Phycisphaerae bacterium]|jgi:molecular chaperone GrpE|nr:nucleotide exchange factor GrpE [Phycisphaerae bacterium]MBT5409346.1 nucleotide exchange factor GrpE [Phycisphaerae bacterium]MBT6164810.1 nucleotide exchange factor GrpE [Phycisphaerae bacterium]MBT7657836.1 nucleotide exchange factor GrpE [Phycisphaerae bacterium]